MASLPRRCAPKESGQVRLDLPALHGSSHGAAWRSRRKQGIEFKAASNGATGF